MPDKKEDLSGAWSEYLNKAIKDYHLFATQVTPMEAKEFTAHHNACKAALAHILMIQKLMQPKENKSEDLNFFDLLEQARKETNEPDNNDSFC